MRRNALRVRTYTFGCKVNRADSAAIETALERRAGARAASPGEEPDVLVVNTCTVTSAADRQARQLLRRLHREHPRARIVVTGCSAEVHGAALGTFAGVADVVPIAEQARIPERLGLPVLEGKACVEVERFRGRTRAFLKLQDGCNAYCAFCVLPYVRGRSRSIPVGDLVAQAKRLEANGYREIVLTGTHLGAFGRDLLPKARLSGAIAAIAAAVPSAHLRVSSIEPTTLHADVIALVAREPRLRPHFHVPLQSGSDAVLRRMNRKHSVAAFRERILALAATRDVVALGTDVIVGFPGETVEDFARTRALLEDLPIPYLHVFRYSARPGTRAATFPDDVPPPEKKRRARVLLELGERRRREFHARFLGTVQPVLVEGKRDPDGRLGGYTPHYVPVRFAGPDRLKEREVEVRLGALDGDVVAGDVV